MINSLFGLIALLLIAPALYAQDSYEALLSRADAEIAQQDYPSALMDCQKALQREPNNPLAHYYKGLIYLRLDKTQDAIDEANKALSLSPADSVKTMIQQLLDKSTSKRSENSDLNLAKLDELSGLRSKAANEYLNIYAFYGSADPAFHAIDLLYSLGDVQAAFSAIRWLSEDSDSETSKKATALMTKARVADASGVYWQLVKHADSLVQSTTILNATTGQLSQANKEYDEATGMFRNCPSDDVCPYWSVARIQAKSGDKNAVEQTLKMALDSGLRIDENGFMDGWKGPGVPNWDMVWSTLACDATFQQFLNDAYGQKSKGAAVTMCNAITATQ